MRAFGQHRLGLLRHFRLDVAAFEDGFNDEIGALEVVVIRRRLDEAEQLVGFFLRGLAAFQRLLQELFGVSLALFGVRLIRVEEDDFHAGQAET